MTLGYIMAALAIVGAVELVGAMWLDRMTRQAERRARSRRAYLDRIETITRG